MLDFKLSTIKYSTLRGLSTLAKDNPYIYDSCPTFHCSTVALIKTADNFYVFGSRNANTIHTQPMDFIGGGLQFDELEVNNGEDIEKNVVKELYEEINVCQSDILHIEGIGIILSTSTNISFIFKVDLRLNKDSLKDKFLERKDDEMSELIFIKEENLEEY